MQRLWIGTSGWTYKSWRGPFYPEKLSQKHWLEWYAGRFPATEINGSFYRTPTLDVVAQWRDCTPRNFMFSWKASRFITHWKRLSAASQNSINLMVTRLDVLGPKAGPVLFQLPRSFKPDIARLESFSAMLPRSYRYVFEFRDPAWYEPPVLALLKKLNIALCISDHHQAPAPWIATARHVYIRGHGPTGRYQDNYPDPTLDTWADTITTWLGQRRHVFVFFDNDQKSAAPADAQRLTVRLLPHANISATHALPVKKPTGDVHHGPARPSKAQTRNRQRSHAR